MANGDVKSIKVLSIDGGGIRGIIPAIILGEMQKWLGNDLHTFFDLIAGTSTGGIIALGIGTACNVGPHGPGKGPDNPGKPYSPDELVNLYVENGPAIFKKGLFTPEKELFSPKYSPDALEETLAQFFQNTELKAAFTPLLISSYDLEGQLPFFFKSHRIAADPAWNWPITSIARATSAAPTFFPPLHLTKGNEDYALVDGGVFVNNPAMAAYAEARALYPDFAKFVVVSVGTGDRQDRITYSAAKDWGLIGWARQVVPVFMDSVSEAVDYQLGFMPGCTYHRLQVPHLQSAESDMDNVTPENLANLQETAREYVASASAELTKMCTELQEGRGSDLPGVGRTTS